jgi:hypothetical protein
MNLSPLLFRVNISQYTEHVMELTDYAYFNTNRFKSRNRQQIILHNCKLQVCVCVTGQNKFDLN